MKKRIDLLLVEKGYFSSREQSKRHIMTGNVFVDNQKIDKAGTTVDVDSDIQVRGRAIPYVSRGGLKLEKALKNFDLTLKDKVCIDIGASTGGFTDCMLQNGAVKVYSVDVGYGQLDWKLRQDKRVICMERQNIRFLEKDAIFDEIEFASIDVSFISLKLVLPKTRKLLSDNGKVVALIKPQFEAGREKVGKKGVVREKSTHIEVINRVSKIALINGFNILDIDFSPIKGPEGNIEYLIYLEKTETDFIKEYKKLFDAENLCLDIIEDKITNINVDLLKKNDIDEYVKNNYFIGFCNNSYEKYYNRIISLVEESHFLER